MRERRKWLLVMGIAALAGIAGAIVMLRARPSAAPHRQPASARIQPVVTEILISGTIQATHVLNVAPPVNGNVEQFLADVGEDVSKGEVLARIGNSKRAAAREKAQLDAEHARVQAADLESALAGAQLEVSKTEADATRARLEFERTSKNFERQQLLMREGITPRLTFEKAEQEYNNVKAHAQELSDAAKKAVERVAALSKELEAARAAAKKSSGDMDEAQANIDAGEVTSPSDGVVIARRGEEGKPVTKALKDFFQIGVDLGALQVTAPADPRLRAGQAGTVQIVEYPGTADAKIREVKGGQVTIDFASPSPSVRPGMTARIKIKLT